MSNVVMEEIELHVGHFGDGTGAGKIVDEVKYARKFIKRIYDILVEHKVPATYYEDVISKNQNQNVNHLVAHHNKDRDGLIVSGHLNASGSVTDRPIGVEVLYSTQKLLATQVSEAISSASGLIDRGAKYRDNIGVLIRTYEPSILIEFGFVNSKKDVELMDKHFEAICRSTAKVLAKAIGKVINDFPINKEESDDKMTFTSSTTKNVVRDFLTQSIGHGYFGKQWLEDFDNGVMTNGDYNGLRLIAEQKKAVKGE